MRKLLVILTVLSALPLMAQRTTQPTEQAKTAGEGEINRQQDFFDPTRKEKETKSNYSFSVDWRLEAGYIQNQQRAKTAQSSNPFLHGVKFGATVDFNLPMHFSVETGLALGITYGRIDQHWRSQNAETVQTEYIRHGINQYYLEVPVRAVYTQKLWKKLNMFFFAGPKLQVGLAEMDWQTPHLSDATYDWVSRRGVAVRSHDRYKGFEYLDDNNSAQWAERELRRCNIQFGLGGGMEWDRYRLASGYDFGLNNLLYKPVLTGAYMWQWGWYVSFCYKL